VRRFPAILLLSVFSFALIAPAVLAADGDSKLPACCRREGRHHCAMPADSSSAGAVVQAVCPAFPEAGAVPAYSKLLGVRPIRAMVASITVHAAPRAQSEPFGYSASRRVRPQRGPPAHLS